LPPKVWAGYATGTVHFSLGHMHVSSTGGGLTTSDLAGILIHLAGTMLISIVKDMPTLSIGP